MKKLFIILSFILFTLAHVFAQSQAPKPQNIETNVKADKHLSSSILLWMRTDKPRQAGMDRWKGPHAQIISANKGLYEYRQIHLSENNPGLWQPINGVETVIPVDRKIDGIADVTLKNIFSIFRGKKQNKLAYKDEVNLFKRTILYASLGNSSRWYNVAQPNDKINSRSMVFFRIREGVKEADFKKIHQRRVDANIGKYGRSQRIAKESIYALEGKTMGYAKCVTRQCKGGTISSFAYVRFYR